MAKTLTCALCGKEITKKLFGGNAKALDIAEEITLPCCEECYEQQKVSAALHYLRFSTKLANYKWVNRTRPSAEQILAMYRQYIAEYEAHKAKSTGAASTYRGWFFESDDEGHFGISEQKLGFMASNITRDDKIAAFQSNIITDFGFTRDDISCIEYRLTDGSFNGLFHQIYSLEICLNKDKDITYRPAYVITAVESRFALLGFRRSARKRALEYLEDFKARIGSDLPIKEVRRFR